MAHATETGISSGSYGPLGSRDDSNVHVMLPFSLAGLNLSSSQQPQPHQPSNRTIESFVEAYVDKYIGGYPMPCDIYCDVCVTIVIILSRGCFFFFFNKR